MSDAPASPAPLPARPWASALVWLLRIVGLLALGAGLVAAYHLQHGAPHLLRWAVPTLVFDAALGVAAALGIAALILRRPVLHAASVAALVVGASGIRDTTAADPWMMGLLAAVLLAAELPDGAARLARLHAGIRVSRKTPAGRDLRLYGLTYALVAPITLLLLAALAIALLRAPEIALGALGLKYQEALETRSVFFVVAVSWVLLGPVFLVRALAGLRRPEQAQHGRPPSPVSTGALLVEENAPSSSAPLVEVTQ